MSRRSRIMLVEENPQQIHLITEAITKAAWSIDMKIHPPGKPTIDALYWHHQDKSQFDLVMLSCTNHSESCIDTLRIIRNYPGFNHQAILVLTPRDPPDDLIHTCHRLGVLKCLEWPSDISAQVLLIMEIKSHFSDDGVLMPRGGWANSSRLTIVKVLTDRIERRILSTP